MKKCARYCLIIILTAIFFVFFASCKTGGQKSSVIELSGEKYITAEENFLVDFSSMTGAGDFYTSNGYSNSGMFDCVWRSDCAKADGGILSLAVRKAGDGFEGAEYRSKKKFSFGFYSVSMKAAACSGVISSFFLYNTPREWDEIDIEFLGKDVTKVQFNYYTGGVGGHEYVYDLGFDASKDFHEYAFYWCEQYIEWYVDGQAVFRATENIPVHASYIMANVWNGKGDGFVGWAGRLDQSKLPVTAEYKWIAYKPAK